MERAPTIILFDGVCNLCSRTVSFLVRRDRASRFRFASLQSDAARRICQQHGLPAPTARDPDSIIVISDGRVLERSDAALAIAARLPFPWPVLGLFCILPRRLRDWIYLLVARNRYRWFGRSDGCMIPNPELRSRFID